MPYASLISMRVIEKNIYIQIDCAVFAIFHPQIQICDTEITYSAKKNKKDDNAPELRFSTFV